MPQEKFCPRHGPYDAALPRCPYCEMESGKRDFPPEPVPLDADEISPHRSWAGGGAPHALQERHPDTTNVDIFADDDDVLPAAPADEAERTVIIGKQAPQEEAETLLGIFWVKEGEHRGKIFPVAQGSIIGRKHGQIRFPDPTISDPHAKITIEEGQFVLWDFGSSNGTFVNGKRIREATPLKENDEIRFGNTVVVLKTLT